MNSECNPKEKKLNSNLKNILKLEFVKSNVREHTQKKSL